MLMRIPTSNPRSSRIGGENLGHGDIVHRIEHRIQQRTCGRVRRVQVEVQDGHVVVSGQSESYYGKQLALQAILDVVGKMHRIELNVHVADGAGPADRSEAYARPILATS